MDSQNCNWGRPKKLRYFPIKESSSAPPKQKVTLRDIEHLFDNLDSASDGEDGLLPLSPLPKTLHAVGESEVLNGQVVPSVGRLGSHELESEIESSFKEPRPIKTSSPIDWKVLAEKTDDDEERTASPLLFDCGEPKDRPASDQNPHCNRLPEDGPYGAKLDSPPNKFALSKSKTSHCNNLEVPCMQVDPTHEKQLQRNQCPNRTEFIRKTQLTEKIGPPAPQMRQEPQCSALSQEPRPKEPTMDKSKQEGKDMSAFLRKLREAGQSKPPCPRKPQSALKSTPPPEPDDDFLILEDDEPCWFAIPRKAAPNKSKNTQKTKAPGLGREVSTDVGARQSQLEKSKDQRASTEATQTLSHPNKGKTLVGVGVSEKPPITTSTTKRSFGKKAKRDTSLAKVTRPELEEDVFSCLDNPSAHHLTKPGQQHQDTNKLNKDLLKESASVRKREKQPVDGASAKSAKLESSVKAEKIRKAKAVDSGKKYSKKSSAKFDQPVNVSRDEVQGLETLENSEPLENMEKLITDEHETDLLPYTHNVLEQDVIPETPTKKKRLIGQQKTMSLDPGFNKSPVKKPLLASGLNSCQEGQLSAKRQRSKPGAWWLSGPVVSERNKDPMDVMTSGSDKKMTVKKSKLNRTKKVPHLRTSSVDSEQDEPFKENMEKLSELPASQTATRKLPVSRRRKKSAKSSVKQSKDVLTQEEEQCSTAEQEEEQDEGQDLDQAQCSPLLRPLRLNTSGDKVFDRVYGHTPSEKVSGLVNPSTPRRPLEHVKTPLPSKRRRQVPSNWWNLNDGPENVESSSSPPGKPGTKKRQTHQRMERKHASRKSLSLGVPKNGNTAHTSKPLQGAHCQLLNEEGVSSRKTVECSLAAFGAIFSSGQKASVKKIRGKKGGCKTLFPSQQQQSAHGSVVSDCPTEDPDMEPVGNAIGYDSSAVHRSSSLGCMELTAECEKNPSSPFYGSEVNRRSKRLSDNTLKGFKSGPSSMMENYEESEDLCLPLSREVEGRLSYSDLCGPPLRPLVLQVEDKVNLMEWLGLLWPANIQNGGQISPDQFHWYSYRSRAMGFHVDLHCDAFCNGKLLLGSFMKKPLLVDHDATSVYNILTSCVSVTINGKKTHHNPGQSFLVPCGHAYSIHNMTHEPAVLYFNRMLAECTD